MKSIADIIADTREYIEKHGWWRGDLRGPNRRQVCTLGGIYYSQGWRGQTERDQHQAEVRQITSLLVQALLGMHPEGELQNREGLFSMRIDTLEITNWNDNYAEDKQDVLDTLAKAEKIARSGYDPDEGMSL